MPSDDERRFGATASLTRFHTPLEPCAPLYPEMRSARDVGTG